jgi:N6-adenosine-specific RNA methylase IME4
MVYQIKGPYSRAQMGAAARHYPLMIDDELLNFPMLSLMEQRAVLLWVTSPRLNFAMDCIRAWRLYYQCVAFDWIKARKDGRPIGAQWFASAKTRTFGQTD